MQKIDDLPNIQPNDLSSYLTTLKNEGKKIISVVPTSGFIVNNSIDFNHYVIVYDDEK